MCQVMTTIWTYRSCTKRDPHYYTTYQRVDWNETVNAPDPCLNPKLIDGNFCLYADVDENIILGSARFDVECPHCIQERADAQH